MMLEMIPIRDGDLEFVRANPFEEQVKLYPKMKPSPISSFTCMFDNEIVAVGGIIDYWQGVGEAWLIMTKQAKKHDIFGLVALTVIEKKMNELIAEHKLRRVQAEVRADFLPGIKMIEALGFGYEGTKRKYTPDGCDMRIYARLI